MEPQNTVRTQVHSPKRSLWIQIHQHHLHVLHPVIRNSTNWRQKLNNKYSRIESGCALIFHDGECEENIHEVLRIVEKVGKSVAVLTRRDNKTGRQDSRTQT